jgi:SAM-dependent methyltransferase
MPDARQKTDRMQQVKAQILQQNTNWLREHHPDELYSRFPHRCRVAQMLHFTRTIRGKVLEIGCFNGFVAEKIQQQGEKEVTGIDRLEPALQQAAARGLQTILADVDESPLAFPANYFDGVVMGEVLDYVFDPDAVIAEVYRVLKPAGKLIVTVPNLASLGNRLRLLYGYPPFSFAARPRLGGYWRYFTFRTLQELLHDQGFQVLVLQANVVTLPFYVLPGLRTFFPGDQWERYRLFSSAFLARLFPGCGENIVALAEKRA